jgi:hypothetical protein
MHAFDRIAREHFRGSKDRTAEALEKLACAINTSQSELLSRQAA